MTDSLYGRQASPSPGQKRSLVLALIASNPRGILELPLKDGQGANLNGIDLSQDRELQSDKTRDNQYSTYAFCPAVSLAHSLLPGACLEEANLSGMDLSQANLTRAILRRAQLNNSNLEQANLENADLAGAQLKQASLGKSNLNGAKLEEADLRAATMRFAMLQNAVLEGANLQGTDLWGADLRNATLKGANLRDSLLNEADLRGADASDADFSNANFVRAHLSRVNFSNSDLRGTNLQGADLSRAIFRGARLYEVDLSSCDIGNACFAGSSLYRTQMNVAQLAGATGEELTGDHEAARNSYLALERNFKSLSDSDATSWAYRKRRRMQKKVALLKAIEEVRSGQTVRGLRCFGSYVSDQIVEFVCDYGESIPRVLATLLIVYLLFMGIYGITGSVTRIVEAPHGSVRVVTRHPMDLAVFSLLAMTTSGSPSVGLQPSHELVHLLTGIQALFGIALTGLLGFVIGHRILR